MVISPAAILAATRQKPRVFSVHDVAFEQQKDFIFDPARLKAIFCTRRAAKSYTAGIYLLHEALSTPRCNCLFVGLTRLSAHGIIWKDILKDIDRRYNLKIKFNETVLTATLPNESVIYVTGADTDEDEMNKLLGKKYRLVVIDEASMFTVNMHQLVYGVLKPATADQRGTIVLAGTASNITRGLFYDITTGKEPGWSLHTWTAFDNPHVAKQWQEELDEIRTQRPNFMDTPLFRQWYLNEWCVDEDALVYKYNPTRSDLDDLPQYDTPYRYVLGVDLGHFPDPTAFVIGAYHEQDPKLFMIHAEKHLKMDITDVAEHIRRLEKRWTFDAKVVDNANAQAVAELNNRHKSNLIAADKHAKVDFINLMNTELIQGQIKLLPSAKELGQEWSTLVWVTDNGVIKEPRKEHPGLPNHLTDAALYLWRHCHQYLFKIPEKPVRLDAQEYWEPRHLKKLEEQVRQEQNPNHWQVTFEPDEDLFDFEKDSGL